MKALHLNETVDWRLNTTFLALLPKKFEASEIGNFKPISLVGMSYKLVAKILANRLKGCLYGIVEQTPGALIKGRQIFDGVLIANEIL